MSVMYVALPIAILLGGTALVACIRAIRGGQFNDLDAPAMRMLIDPEPIESGEVDPKTSNVEPGDRQEGGSKDAGETG